MKCRKIILSLFSILLGATFLIGSTGITVVIHSCSHCDNTSVQAGMFLSPREPVDHCCEYASNEHASHDLLSIAGECCHFKIDKLKLVNYEHSGKTQVIVTSKAPLILADILVPIQAKNIIVPYSIHNKHGGRYLVTYNCQYLS